MSVPAGIIIRYDTNDAFDAIYDVVIYYTAYKCKIIYTWCYVRATLF